MKHFKKLMCLVLAFLMVCTSISWNGLQVVEANDSTETVTTYYFDQTFEDGYADAKGTFGEEGLTTSVVTVGDTKAKSIPGVNKKAFACNFSEEITSEMATTVYVETDIITDTEQLPKIQVRLGSSATVFMNTNTSGSALRLQDSDSTNFITIKKGNTYKVGLILHLDTGAVDFYELDASGEWPTAPTHTLDGKVPSSISTLDFYFTADDGRALILDNIKVYTITEETGGGDSGDGDDTGSDTETVTDGVYFQHSFTNDEAERGTFEYRDEMVYEYVTPGLTDSTRALKLTWDPGVKGSFTFYPVEALPADKQFVYVEMDVATTGTAPSGNAYLQSKNSETNANANSLKFSDVNAKATTWKKICIKLDDTTTNCLTYVYNTESGAWDVARPSGRTSLGATPTHFTITYTNGTSSQEDLLIDNLKVYASDEDIFAVEEPTPEPTPEPKQAEVNGTQYPTLKEALEAASLTGATVELLEDVTYEGTIVMGDNVTLDLNARTLTVDYLAAFNGVNVVDNSADKSGFLKIGEKNLVLPESNSQMPVWDTDGYRLANVKMFAAEGTNSATIASLSGEYIYLIMEPSLGSVANELLKDGSTNNKLHLGVRLSWEKDDTTHVQDCYFNDTYVETSYVSTKDGTIMNFTVEGLEAFPGITATPFVASDLGVIYFDSYHRYEATPITDAIVLADWTSDIKTAAPVEFRNVKPTAEAEATVATYLNNMTSHPRILISEWDGDDGVATKVINALNNDATGMIATWYKKLKTAADKYVAGTNVLPTPAESPSISETRTGREHLQTLAFVYNIETARGTKNAGQYLEKAYEDMITMGNWLDWDGYSHYLSTAELLFGYSCAYDWLYDDLTETQRAKIYDIVKEKALKPLVYNYEYKNTSAIEEGVTVTWSTNVPLTTITNNWNPVCNGSAISAALAFAEEEKDMDVAGYILEKAPEYLRNSLVQYEPEGAYPEGVSYWDLGTLYLIFATDMMENGFKNGVLSKNVAEVKNALATAGDFPLYFNGTTSMFNYGDCNAGKTSTVSFYWLAEQFNKPQYTWYQNKAQTLTGHEAIAAICFYDDALETAATKPTILDKFYGKTADAASGKFNGVSMRSSWDDSALYAAMQGGNNGANHMHLSLGTYVIDWQGERFIHQLGRSGTASNVDKYYYTRAEGNNTLVINPSTDYDQLRKGYANLVESSSTDDTAFGILDMSQAYNAGSGTEIAYAKRGLMMTDKRTRVIVQDEVTVSKASEFYWYANTNATIHPVTNGVADMNKDLGVNAGVEVGDTVLLELNGKYMLAHISTSTKNAQFQVVEAKSTIEDVNNDKLSGEKKLAIHVAGVSNFILAVEYIALDGKNLQEEITEALANTRGYISLDSWGN